MGIGLANMSVSYLNADGASITGDNESTLGGVRFSFTLPVADTACASGLIT